MIDLTIVALLIIAAVLATTASLIVQPASLALVITACGILLTWRAARAQKSLAERKMFLDLMPRRAEWFDRLRAAIAGRQSERWEQAQMLAEGKIPTADEHSRSLYRLQTEAAWLFDVDMLALMVRIMEADEALATLQADARMGNRAAATELTAKHFELFNEHQKLQDYLVRYLYVGDIGKPSRSPITFASVRNGFPRRLWARFRVMRR